MDSVKDKADLVIYPSKVRYLFFSLVLLFFVLASLEQILYGLHINVLLVGIPIRTDNSNLHVAIDGLIGLIIFTPLFMNYAYRILAKKPSIIVLKDGILDNATLMSAGFIRWSEIEKVSIDRQGLIGQKILVITLKDSISFINQNRGIKKKLLELRTEPIYIKQNDISIRIVDLLEKIQTTMTNSDFT